jgi:TRAP-type C4-dicarboxylate transport system permease small subunit
MSRIESISDFLYKITRVGTALVIAVMLLVTSVQVFARYVLNHSFFWSEELVRYLFVWTAFLGGSLALKEGNHLAIDVLTKYFKGPIGKTILFINDLVVVSVLLVLLYYGTKLTWVNIPSESIALEITMSIPYAIIPIGSFLMLIHYSVPLYRKLINKEKDMAS